MHLRRATAGWALLVVIAAAPGLAQDPLFPADTDALKGDGWTFIAGGPVHFEPVVSGGRAYFTSDDGHLYCVDARTGALRWKVRGGPSDRMMIALTFDDGPSPVFLEKAMPIFREHGARGTLFVVGKRLEKHGGLVKELADQGREIGNHSLRHARLPDLEDARAASAEIKGAQDAIRRITRKAPVSLRAPFLAHDRKVWNVLNYLELRSYGRSVAGDYRGEDTTQFDAAAHAQKIIDKTRDGAIILIHERDHNARFLDVLLSGLKSRGYRMVTLSELAENASGS